jgi:hypothetical protein
MLNSPPRVCETRFDVINFKIRHFLDNLSHAEPCCQQIEYITDPDTHAPHAGTAAALLWIERDAFKKRFH